jgi:alpha-N-arabinofuranosidase
MVNRSLTEAVELVVDVRNLGEVEVVDAQTLHEDDVLAKNTLDEPERVGLKRNTAHSMGGGTLRITLPPVSWTAVTLR